MFKKSTWRHDHKILQSETVMSTPLFRGKLTYGSGWIRGDLLIYGVEHVIKNKGTEYNIDGYTLEISFDDGKNWHKWDEVVDKFNNF